METRSCLLPLVSVIKNPLHVFHFLPCKFQVAPYIHRPTKDVVFEDKSAFSNMSATALHFLRTRENNDVISLRPAMTTIAVPVAIAFPSQTTDADNLVLTWRM